MYLLHQDGLFTKMMFKILVLNFSNFFLPCFLHIGAIPMSTAYFGRGNATILIQDFRCTGREQSLQQCSPSNYSISSYYSRGYNVFNRYVHIPFSLLNISSCYTYTSRIDDFTWQYMVSQPTDRYLTSGNMASSFQRPSGQRYLSGKHHLPVWVQLWRSSSCWWREGEWGQSGDLHRGVLGDCVRHEQLVIWERRGNSRMQATGHEDIRYRWMNVKYTTVIWACSCK